MDYSTPPKTRIGHVHLKVSNLDKALEFYQGILGFEIKQQIGDQAAFLAAGDYHHHIGLNTWNSKDHPPADKHGVGLFHSAFLYAERIDLARILARLIELNYPLTGTADHGVSEAIYLNDPDGNGVELYWDKPKEQWPVGKSGKLDMYTRPLDINNLLNEIK